MVLFLRQPVLKVEVYGNSDVVECLSGSGEYNVGDDVNFSFVAEEKYCLSEIYYIVDGTEEKVYIAENTFKMPNKPITVYAVFEIIKYSLNVHTQNGEVVLSKLKAAEGEEITVTAIPNEGYRLLRIYYTTEGSFINFEIDGSFVMPRKDVDICAEFITDDNYIITIDNDEGGGEFFVMIMQRLEI